MEEEDILRLHKNDRQKVEMCHADIPHMGSGDNFTPTTGSEWVCK